MGRPPVFVGATQLSPALPIALVPTNDVGASGRPAAITALEGLAKLGPMPLTDLTEKI